MPLPEGYSIVTLPLPHEESAASADGDASPTSPTSPTSPSVEKAAAGYSLLPANGGEDNAGDNGSSGSSGGGGDGDFAPVPEGSSPGSPGGRKGSSGARLAVSSVPPGAAAEVGFSMSPGKSAFSFERLLDTVAEEEDDEDGAAGASSQSQLIIESKANGVDAVTS